MRGPYQRDGCVPPRCTRRLGFHAFFYRNKRCVPALPGRKTKLEITRLNARCASFSSALALAHSCSLRYRSANSCMSPLSATVRFQGSALHVTADGLTPQYSMHCASDHGPISSYYKTPAAMRFLLLSFVVSHTGKHSCLNCVGRRKKSVARS